MTSLHLAYFAAGLLRDALGTTYYRAISGKWVLSASALAGGITLYDLLVLATLLKQWSVGLAVAYAVGTAAGTTIALKIRKKA
jgi:hypothetical protein